MGKGLHSSVANSMLDHELGSAAGVMPNPVFIGLSTADPGATGAGFTEPGGGIGYSRVSVANTVAKWPAAVAGEKKNADAITFPTATGGWGTVGWYGIFNLATGGALLGWGALDTARTVNNNDTFQFGPNELVLKLANQA